MPTSFEELSRMAQAGELARLVESHALRLGTAIAVLLFGWLIALIASGLVRKAIQKANLNASLGKSFSESELARPIPLDRWISRTVFYVLLLFVFVAFFEVLGIAVINEPLNRFLVRVFEFIPQLIGPVVLILIAWVVATFLKFVVQKLMGNARLTALLNEWVGIDNTIQSSAAKTMGNIVYWVVFLIFSLAVLDALNLRGLLDPLQQMFQEVLGFLPQLFGACLIFGVGWFIARVIQRVVSGLTETMGADRLARNVGIDAALGKRPLSHWLGVISYALVLIPVLIASLNALNLHSITTPVSDMLNEILTTLPKLLAALLVLGAAYFIGRLVREIVTATLTSAGFNGVLAKMGIGTDPSDYNTLLGKMGIGEAPKEGTRTPSEILGFIVFVAIMLFAGIEALELVGFQAVALLLTRFVIFFSQVLLGLLIFGFALFISNLVARTILSTGNAQSRVLAIIARVAILVLAGAMALQQMGLAERIINLTFGILLGSVALAAAVAFGIGGKDVAGQLLKELVASFRRGTR